MKLAWHNNREIKDRVVDELIRHREADAIIQGTYLQRDSSSPGGFRGCAVGCVVGSLRGVGEVSNWHGIMEQECGIPAAVNHLIDRVFEGLSTKDDEHAKFVVDVINAVPVGADLSMVSAQFMIDVLSDPEHGVSQFVSDDFPAVREAIDKVRALYERRLARDEPNDTEWAYAAYAAYAARAAARAAADAADVAAYAVDAARAAADAARAAAYAADAARAAADVAYAAAYAAADAADAAHWQWMGERLMHRLANAPVVSAHAS